MLEEIEINQDEHSWEFILRKLFPRISANFDFTASDVNFVYPSK